MREALAHSREYKVQKCYDRPFGNIKYEIYGLNFWTQTRWYFLRNLLELK